MSRRTRRPNKKKELTIIQCLHDKRLLGQFIEDESTFDAWFCFLRAFFALPAMPGDMELYQSCTSRSVWPTTPSTEAWMPCGVRGGKSFVISILAIFYAFFRKYNLSKGEIGYVLCVAPTRKQAGIIKNYISGFLRDHPILRGHVQNETIEEITLDNGLAISVLSSDYKSIRGFTAIACIIDEIAYLSVEGAKPDEEVVRSLRSRLLTTNGPLICIGSPYARRGELFKTFQRHYGKNDSPILVWKAASKVMNPTLSDAAIEKARLEDPQAAMADYDAEFRNDIETFVNREAVEACVVPKRLELPPIPGKKYFAFVDPSGGSQDSYTLAVSYVDSTGKDILSAVRERKPPFSPEAVTYDFATLLKTYGITEVYGDKYGGEFPRELFLHFGIRYITAEKTKSELYAALLPKINSGQVELLDIKKLVDQLCLLERKVGRGTGRDIIDHPPNGRDDVINSVAGVFYLSGRIKYAGTWDTIGGSQSRYRGIDLQKIFPGSNGLGSLSVHVHDLTKK